MNENRLKKFSNGHIHKGVIDTKIGACVLSSNLENVILKTFIWDVEIQHISKAL